MPTRLANDFYALRSFNTKEHIYLSVEGKGEKAHLEVKKKGIFGRIWMWLGFSSASMKKVIAYTEKLLEKNPNLPELYPTLKAKLADKIVTKYAPKHHYNVPEVVRKYLNIAPSKKEEPIAPQAVANSIFDFKVPDDSLLNKNMFDTLTPQQKEILGWEEPIPNGKRKDRYPDVISVMYNQNNQGFKNWQHELKDKLRRQIQGNWSSTRLKIDYEQEAAIIIEAIEQRLEILKTHVSNIDERLMQDGVSIHDICMPFNQSGLKMVLATKDDIKNLTFEHIVAFNDYESAAFDKMRKQEDSKYIQEFKTIHLEKLLSYPDEAYRRRRTIIGFLAYVPEERRKEYAIAKELSEYSKVEEFVNKFLPGVDPNSAKAVFARNLFARYRDTTP